MTPTDTTAEDVWRECAPHVLAALVRKFGDFEAAEDALQEALADAHVQWPAQGIPERPRGWLIRVAERRLIDHRRSEDARLRREERLAVQPGPEAAPDTDDSLTLLLLCCHPALSPDLQVALTLRAVGGLSTAQIARAFLVPEATMTRRITRAKTRLRQADARFTSPPPHELPDRIRAVAHVLYLIFTEGHTATTGTELTDSTLAAEAIRLTRQLHTRLPADTEITGLLALMLLTHARRAARLDAHGNLRTLTDQDRTRWDTAMVTEGVHLLETALPTGPVGPYQLQAAIAAVHAEAKDAAQTDWPQIVLLYEMLQRLTPSPVLTLNHAVAVAETRGPAEALAMIRPLLEDPALRRQHRVHAVHAHLLRAAGQEQAARAKYARAAELATSIAEQRYLNAQGANQGRT
ncbi:RNA polymerase sigma24 factor [Kineosporia sp. NBRC 101677]|nr:RNA polymerase sigma24 factor [Kineosporia sp. NBRC 101677]